MAGIFTVAAADIAQGQIFWAMITNIEVRSGGENSSQYQDVGKLEGCELSFTPKIQKSQGNITNQLGFFTDIKGNLLITGTNLRTAIANVIGNTSECRLTDVNGHKFTLLYSELGLAIGEEIKGDGEGSRKFPLTGTGYMTKARWLAAFATA